MHQLSFGGGAPPGPTREAYNAPQDPLDGFKGPASKGREEGQKGKGGYVRVEREGRSGNGRREYASLALGGMDAPGNKDAERMKTRRSYH